MLYPTRKTRRPNRSIPLFGQLILLTIFASLITISAHAAEPAKKRTISFRHDIMALLSKAGCNAGVCHGNANGKGGFKLSLRGQDPEFDFLALTRNQFGRRINLIDPTDSILLHKPTTLLSHQGGKRFDKNSDEYRMLYKWIASGSHDDKSDLPKLTELTVTPVDQVLEPDQAVQIKATATFSDGAQRDVTHVAVYEPSDLAVTVTPRGLARSTAAGQTTILVRYLHKQQAVRLWFVPSRPDFKFSDPKPYNLIDGHVFNLPPGPKQVPARLRPHEVAMVEYWLAETGGVHELDVFEGEPPLG